MIRHEAGDPGTKEKEFIALGIAVAVHCVPCIRLTRGRRLARARAGGDTGSRIGGAAHGGRPCYTHIPVVTEHSMPWALSDSRDEEELWPLWK